MALVLHLVLAVATIGGVLVAVLVYTRRDTGDDCKTCADNVEYISTSMGLNSQRAFRVVSDRQQFACFR